MAKISYISLCILLSATACSTLPTQHHYMPQYSNIQDSSTSPLAQHIIQQRKQHPEHLTGYHLLANPNEAIAARFSLIQNAQKTLDIQYYIWHNDQIGTLTFHYLIQAADRGVKIRLLIDDNNAKSIEGILLALSQHQNISVKLFNPYRFRKYRAVDMLLDLKRINRRMHNKSLIADHQLSIIGGRNMANEYYNASQRFQFADIDILLAGRANDEVVQSFDEYWNHHYAYHVQDIVKAHHHTLRFPSLKQQLIQTEQDYIQKQDVIYQTISQHTVLFSQWLTQQFDLEWVNASIIYDPANKINHQAVEKTFLYPQLLEKLAPTTEKLNIISAYFIPEKNVAEQLNQLEQKGVEVKILTNSVAGNDVKAVNAFYNKHRTDLLQNGIELYEFKPLANISQFMNNGQEVTPKLTQKELNSISPKASLHAKTAIFDEHQVFIGSFNLDPRSHLYNSEIGVLLDSPKLAKNLQQAFELGINQYAWQLTLNAQQQIQWQNDQQSETYHKEPQTKWWHRGLLKFLGVLPIEKMF